MQVLGYSVFFGAFAWFVVTVQNRRRLVAVTLAGIMLVTIVGAPQPAQAQIGLLQAIQAVLNVINGANLRPCTRKPRTPASGKTLRGARVGVGRRCWRRGALHNLCPSRWASG